MKYKYYEKDHSRLIAESDSPIQFNAARFPCWKSIIPVVEEEEVKAVEEVKVVEEVIKPRARTTTKRKKTEEDMS